MDQPGLDPAAHAAALRGLARLNRASRIAASLFGAIHEACTPIADRPLRILDIATGGGDVARGLWRRANQAGIALEVHGLDFSETAIEYARACTDEPSQVTFAVADVLRDPLPGGYDVVTSTLFMHHLTEEQARSLLRRMADAANAAVLVSDLRRSVAGYLLAQLACRTLSRSPIVHADGPMSVEGAFTIAEFRRLSDEAGLTGVTVRRTWPQRFLAAWRRDQA